MWLNGDTDTFEMDQQPSGEFRDWLRHTANSVVATSVAVGLTAVIHKISGHIVNIGLPQRHSLGAPGQSSGHAYAVPAQNQLQQPQQQSHSHWQRTEVNRVLQKYD